MVGFIYTAPMLHVWHSKIVPVLSKRIFPENVSKFRRVFTLVTCDQFLFVPILLTGFFMVNSLVNSPSK